MAIPAEFDEIRPYDTGEVQQAFNELLADRQFSTMLRGIVPWLPKSLRNAVLKMAFIGVKSPLPEKVYETYRATYHTEAYGRMHIR